MSLILFDFLALKINIVTIQWGINACMAVLRKEYHAVIPIMHGMESPKHWFESNVLNELFSCLKELDLLVEHIFMSERVKVVD